MRAWAGVTAAAWLAVGAQAQPESARVDTSTYVGWRVFETHCASCHGIGGEGTDFAPELAPRIKRMDFQSFSTVLDDGYPGVSSLPPWGERRDVARYYAELWDYLNARATGAVPASSLQLQSN
jgi:mono/diheme cytochrome c family protein